MFEQQLLKEQFGNPYTNRTVERLQRFAYIPPHFLELLSSSALTEEWGNKNFVLEKYLAVHIAWSIEQGRYTHSENQLYVTA